MNLAIDFILIAGLVVNSIILLILFKSKAKELPQKLLILFFAMLFVFMLHFYSSIHDIDILWILTFILHDSIELFIGPLIYVYIKSLFENNKTLIKKNWIHFLPVILYLVVISIPILISFIQRDFLFSYLEFLNNHTSALFTSFMIYLLTYLILSLRLFYKYRFAMQFNFSNFSESDFGWVRNMLIGTIVVASIDLVTSIKEMFSESERDYDFITLILVVILIIYLGYYGIKQTKILLPDFLLQDSIDENSVNKIRVLSANDELEYEKSKQRLLEILENEKVYLDEDLTLNKLAQYIPTTDKKLSMLLNQYMDTTFYDFISQYRVSSVKEKLDSKDFEHITLLGIAYESGFKSKTSFNRIFKKETGLSPSEYKKSLKNL